MASPVTPETIGDVATQGSACDRFNALLRTRGDFRDFLDWLLGDDGNLSDTVLAGFADRISPVGQIVGWPSTDIPSEFYRVCNGAALSRTEFATLFARIGTRYGAGDGVTTFNLPDLRGRFIRGVPLDSAVGVTGGADSVALSANEVPLVDHFHGIGTLRSTTPSSVNSMWVLYKNYENTESLTAYFIAGDPDGEFTTPLENTDKAVSGYRTMAGTRTGGLGTTNAKMFGDGDQTALKLDGSGNFSQYSPVAHENRPPFTNMHWLIKVK